MRIAEVIGTVTLNRSHPSLRAASYRLVVPLTEDNLTGKTPLSNEPLVALDQLGSGLGDRVAISEGGEAAQPFFPDLKPIDAYIAAILDRIDLADL